jgi:hypothetical protein
MSDARCLSQQQWILYSLFNSMHQLFNYDVDEVTVSATFLDVGKSNVRYNEDTDGFIHSDMLIIALSYKCLQRLTQKLFETIEKNNTALNW